jgi:arylsulfatase A-like enzyme
MQPRTINFLDAGYTAASLCWLILLVFCQCNSRTTHQLPNIIIINVDDMGWRDVSFMGSQFYETPNIDSLAAMGMVFNNGYASAANCAPSRACLMTGLWTPRHGVYTVGSSERGKSTLRRLIPIKNKTTLTDGVAILPELLKVNGYSTFHAGKWHLSDDPTERGFDYNIGGAQNGHPQSYYYPYGNVDLEGAEGDHLTDQIMDRVVDFVRSVKRPFFLYYAPYAVHTPIQPVEGLLGKFQSKASWNGQQNADYASMVENLDRNIGLLLQTLKTKGSLQNTMIVFTSDNGGLFGITYQFPLRAGKGSYYEGGIRVPFFFVWPDRIQRGRQNETPISNIDLFPTLLDAAGIDLEQTRFDGQNLLPLLVDSQPLEQRPLFWHFPIYLQAYDVNNNQDRDSLFRTRPGSVVRFGEWKLHHYFEDDGVELYNLREDISEQRNLALEHPDKSAELYRLLDQWRKQVEAPIPSEPNPEFESEL